MDRGEEKRDQSVNRELEPTSTDAGVSITIAGPHGTGKSLMAALIFAMCSKHGIPVECHDTEQMGYESYANGSSIRRVRINTVLTASAGMALTSPQ